jgi:hypothetical protein
MGAKLSKKPTNIIIPIDSKFPQDGIPLEGNGKYTTNDGMSYIGGFHNGGFHGKGTFKYTDGAVYNGDWLAHQRHGKGILQYITGEVYNGDFLYDEIHGWGKLVYTSGDIFEGQFLFGCQNGIGTYINSEKKRIYHGQWFNNLFHGHGIYYHENGRKMYDGNWKTGLCHGFGTLYDSNGKRIYRGIWIDGYMAKLHSNSSTESPILSPIASNTVLYQEETPYAPPETDSEKQTNRQRILLNPLTQIKDKNQFENIFHPVNINDINDKVSFNPVRISRLSSRKNSPNLKAIHSTDPSPFILEPLNKPTGVINPFAILSSIAPHPLGLQNTSIPEDDKSSCRSDSSDKVNK